MNKSLKEFMQKYLNTKNPVTLFSIVFLIFALLLIGYYTMYNYANIQKIFSHNTLDYIMFALSCYLSAIISSIWCKYSEGEIFRALKSKKHREKHQSNIFKFNIFLEIKEEYKNIIESKMSCKNDDLLYLIIISIILSFSFIFTQLNSQKNSLLFIIIIFIISISMKRTLAFFRYVLEFPKVFFILKILNISQISSLQIFFIISFGSIIYYFFPRGIFGFELFTFFLFNYFKIDILKWILFIIFTRYIGTLILIPFIFLKDAKRDRKIKKKS